MPNRSSNSPLLVQCLLLGLLAMASTAQGQSCKPITFPAGNDPRFSIPGVELSCSKQKPSDDCVVAGYKREQYRMLYVTEKGELTSDWRGLAYCRHTHVLEGKNFDGAHTYWCPSEAFLPDGVGVHVCAAAEQQHRLNATLLGAKDQAEARSKALEAELKAVKLCQSAPKSTGCIAPVPPASPLSKPKK
jgi:hypothetical protein